MNLMETLGLPGAQCTIPHPGGPLRFERLNGGGGPAPPAVRRELSNMGDGMVPPPSIDANMMGQCDRCQALPPHILRAHVLALEAFTVAEAREAIELADGGPCPQAHVRLAETEAETFEAALARYTTAALQAEQMIELFAPPLPVGTHVTLAELSRADYNGLDGRITGWNVSKRRFAVLLLGVKKESLLLKPTNLVPSAELAETSAAMRQAGCSDGSLWKCLPARPWFRAWIGVGNTRRKMGDYEGAIRAYMTIVDVDGDHFVTNSSHFVQYRSYVASCHLLLGQPREAKRFLLETCGAVAEYTFKWNSSSLFFTMDLALAELMIAREEGRELGDLPDIDIYRQHDVRHVGPGYDTEWDITGVTRLPGLVWYWLCGGVLERTGETSFRSAVPQYLFDDSKRLPDLERIPPVVGEASGHAQALAYLGGGILELWRNTPGAIALLLRCAVSTAVLGAAMHQVAENRSKFPEPLASLRRLLAQEVSHASSYACKLLKEAIWFEPAAERAEAVRLVLSAVGEYCQLDIKKRHVESALCQAAYYDNEPVVIALLVRAGALVFWPRTFADDEHKDESGVHYEVSPLSPCSMAVEQGSWRALAVCLALSPAICTDAVLSNLAEGLWVTSCFHCVAGLMQSCGRCTQITW